MKLFWHIQLAIAVSGTCMAIAAFSACSGNVVVDSGGTSGTESPTGGSGAGTSTTVDTDTTDTTDTETDTEATSGTLTDTYTYTGGCFECACDPEPMGACATVCPEFCGGGPAPAACVACIANQCGSDPSSCM